MFARQPLAALIVVLGLVAAAWAHSETIEPPPPPPPDPSGRTPDPPGGIGPTTPGGEARGPTTGGGDPGKGPTTPGGRGAGPAPETGGPRPTLPGPRVAPEFDPNRSRAPTASGGASPDHWSFWWRTVRFRYLERRAAPVDTTPGRGDAEAPRPEDELWRAEARGVLAAHLDDRDLDVATSCAVALGKSGDSSYAAALTAILVNRRRRQTEREAAALGLGLLHDAGGPSRAALEDVALGDDEPTRLRAMAIHALGLRREPASLPFLLQMCGADEATPDVVAAALSALGALGDSIVAEDLAERLGDTRRASRHERVYAAQGLARGGHVGALGALERAAGDRDEHVRRAAYLALGALTRAADDGTTDAGNAVDVLVRAVHREKNRGARHAAALALGETGHDRAGATLLRMYEKGDALDQHFAALALGLLARARGEPALVSRLASDLEKRANSDLRSALSIAVGLARYTDAAPVVRAIVVDRGDPVVRAHAALALGMLGRAEDAAVLRELATSERDAGVRREAALGLGLIGDRGAVALLAAEIERGTTLYAQGASAIGLGYLGGPQAARTLTAMIADAKRPAIVRALAASGLGIVLDADGSSRLAEVAAHLDWTTLTQTVHEILRVP